ncbi:helix-turn-helix domain-containing protein [Reichenbachiella versicolor]|uniref:helix-turn-helix domain-containing protein n=1 Tax=Reichenbachiella versicolor TaxID=1821036 RepID=UPI001C869902|nr:helix-turn-helix domain-containing protein [Reichenbachiella versicolor]
MSKLKQNLSAPLIDSTNFYVFDSDHVPVQLQQLTPFRNDFYALIFVLKGEMDIKIDFKHYRLQSQNVGFISPNQVIDVNDKQVEFAFGILFKKDFLLLPIDWLQKLPLFHRFHSTPILTLSDTEQNLISSCLSQMINEQMSSSAYKYDILKANLILVLAHLSRIYSQSKLESEPKQNKVILEFETLIEKHYMSIRLVNEYADMLYMTPQNLNRVCKNITGLTASELINKKILLETKRFLIYTDNSIEEIAYTFNFYDNSYFTKYFKKATGLTPKQYRKEKNDFLENDGN